MVYFHLICGPRTLTWPSSVWRSGQPFVGRRPHRLLVCALWARRHCTCLALLREGSIRMPSLVPPGHDLRVPTRPLERPRLWLMVCAHCVRRPCPCRALLREGSRSSRLPSRSHHLCAICGALRLDRSLWALAGQLALLLEWVSRSLALARAYLPWPACVRCPQLRSPVCSDARFLAGPREHRTAAACCALAALRPTSVGVLVLLTILL